MTYNINSRSINNITRFYKNVAKKYKYAYSKELMNKNIDDAINAIYQIEVSLLRRQPTIQYWQDKGCYMANTKKWYYLYKVKGETITIVDTCHSQNMKESVKQKIVLKEFQLRRMMRESIKRVLNLI